MSLQGRVRVMDKKAQTLVLKGYPQEKQKKFFLADAKYIAYGGARGGGKSWALRRKLVLLALNYAGISMLLIRRTFPELRDNHIRPLIAEIGSFCSYSDSRKCFEFPNGSRLKLGYLDNDGDLLQYQGQEYDIIALDEATQLTEYQFQTLKACLRGVEGFPKRMYITCNPGGVGHGWVKRLFIDRDFKECENPDDYEFIQALVYDNKILLENNPDYLDQLKSLPVSLRDAWLRGKWDEFEGQFFPEFDYEKHTCEVFLPQGNVRKYCSIDYGLDMLAALFIAVDESGGVTVYDEIHKENLIVSRASELIKEKMEGVSMVIAPSDLWSRQKDSGKSIAELFSENGVFLTKQRSERIGGWMALRELLKDEGRLKITRNCTNLIRCLPLLLHDKQRIGDASTQPHAITHAPDALRYFAVSGMGDVYTQRKKEKSKKLKDNFKRRKGYETIYKFKNDV